MKSDDYLEVSKLLTELRWVNAAMTSFLPQSSKGYKELKTKIDRIAELSAMREAEGLKFLSGK